MDALLKSRRANVQTLKLMPLFYYGQNNNDTH